MKTATANTEQKPKSARKTRKQRARAIISKARKAEAGIIGQILALYKKGFERKEIIDLGYNKNTVHRQVHEFETA